MSKPGNKPGNLNRLTRGMERAAGSSLSMLGAIIVLPLMLVAMVIAHIASYSGNPAVKRMGRRLGEFDFGPPAIPPHMGDDSDYDPGQVVEGEIEEPGPKKNTMH